MNPQQPFQPQTPYGASQPPQYQSMPPQQQVPPTPMSPQGPLQPQSAYIKPVQSKRWLIVAVVFITTTLLLGGFSVWAMMNYLDQKDNVDAKVSEAVAVAVKEQADKDAEEYQAELAKTTQLFSGPEDYGTLSFSYRKDWSLYVEGDASDGDDYEAYFSPGEVPSIDDKESRYALRLTIADESYEDTLADYEKLVEDGDLKSTVYKIDEETSATRLDGSFSDDIRGSALIFKIRDKTVTMRTDAETFKSDFDNLIATIDFVK